MEIQLTDADRAKFPEYLEEYGPYALNTGDTDKERAARGIAAHYTLSNLAVPPLVWVKSPPVGAFAAPIAALVIHRMKEATDGKSSKVKACDGSHILTGPKWITPAVVKEVDDTVRQIIRIATPDRTEKEFNAAYASIKPSDLFWHDWMGGQFWMPWTAYAIFLNEWKKVEIPHLEPRKDTDMSCAHWWPNESFSIACERPTRASVDELRRAHCDHGMAMEWKTEDGKGVGMWMWHGVRTCEKAIMRPSEITIDDIKAEDNAESRRVLVERMGYEKYTEEGKIEVIDRDFTEVVKGSGGLMPRILVKDGFGDRFLFGTDGSTERCYMMPVPVTSKTCREAHESICGLDESLCVAQS